MESQSQLTLEAVSAEQLPSLVHRLKAAVVDTLILLLVLAVSSFLGDMLGAVSDYVKLAVTITMFLLYEPLLTAFAGGTVGHKLLGLRVKRMDDPSRNISFINAIIRFFTKAILGVVSFFTVTSTKEKRAIHDMLAGSIILKH